MNPPDASRHGLAQAHDCQADGSLSAQTQNLSHRLQRLENLGGRLVASMVLKVILLLAFGCLWLFCCKGVLDHLSFAYCVARPPCCFSPIPLTCMH